MRLPEQLPQISWLKTIKIHKSKMEVPAGWVPPGGCEGELSHGHLRFPWLLAVLTPISASIFTLPSSPCVSLCILSSTYKDISHWV